MKKLIWFALLWSYAIPVQAAIFDITMTVDNGYGLYAGTPDSLVKIGDSKVYNILETYSSDFSAGQFMYVYAWDWGYAEGFIGQFLARDPAFSNFFTTLEDGWEVMTPLLQNNSASAAVPDAARIQSEITGAVWSDVEYYNVLSRWGVTFTSYPFASPVQAIWGEPVGGIYSPGGLEAIDSYIFRHEITGPANAVPIPGALILAGAGLLSLAGIRRKFASPVG